MEFRAVQLLLLFFVLIYIAIQYIHTLIHTHTDMG